MNIAILRMRAFVRCVLLIVAGTRICRSQVAVTTWHYDNARSGANSNETILTPQNVNSKQFGKLFTQPVDGADDRAGAVFAGGHDSGAGTHNVVYVATMHDSVYAFDADNETGNNANPLWHTSFLKKGVTTVPIALQGCGATTKWTEVGIVSTPVIDPVSGTIYVVAKTYENSSLYIGCMRWMLRPALKNRAARW